MITWEVKETRAGVQEIAGAWDALCDASGASTPFQRPAWLLAWLDRIGGADPRVLVLRSGRDLVGLLPACAWGSPPARTLSLLGAGLSDHLDAVAAPGFEATVRGAVEAWLAEGRGGWDCCLFDEVGPGALLRGVRAPQGTSAAVDAQSVCPVLALADGDAGLERSIPHGQWARLRKARRRCEKHGAVAIERADRADFAEALGILFDLHARRWSGRGAPGAVADPRVVALHREAAAAFARRGALRLYVLRLAGRPAAVIYGFRERRRLYLYMQGIDPELERMSPGVVAVGGAAADALAEGVREVDFLRGGEPYKYAWGAADEPNVRIVVTRRFAGC